MTLYRGAAMPWGKDVNKIYRNSYAPINLKIMI